MAIETEALQNQNVSYKWTSHIAFDLKTLVCIAKVYANVIAIFKTKSEINIEVCKTHRVCETAMAI